MFSNINRVPCCFFSRMQLRRVPAWVGPGFPHAVPQHRHTWPKSTILTVLTLTSWSQGSAGPQDCPVIILSFPHSPALPTRLVTMLHNWINWSCQNRPSPHVQHPPSVRVHVPCPSSWQCDLWSRGQFLRLHLETSQLWGSREDLSFLLHHRPWLLHYIAPDSTQQIRFLFPFLKNVFVFSRRYHISLSLFSTVSWTFPVRLVLP